MSDRNKMFGSRRDREPGEEASPSRTIVGGRPPERDRILQGLPTGIQRLLVAASLQEEFKRRLLADPTAAAREAGLELTPGESAILAAIPRDQLRVMAECMHVANPARREFLVKAAAATLAVAAGTVLSDCGLDLFHDHQVGGIQPGIPPLLWTTSLDEALGEAAETRRPVLAFFWFDPHCREDGTIRSRGAGADCPPLVAFWFENEGVRGEVVSGRFLTVKVVHPSDMTWGPGEEDEREDALRVYTAILAAYEVELFPTVLFLAPDRSVLFRLVQPRREVDLSAAILAASAIFSHWGEAGPTEGIRPDRP
jgi:hypothetical protein